MQYKAKKKTFNEITRLSPFPCSLLLEFFPFGVIINPNMNLIGVGEKLAEIWRGKDFLNKPVSSFFKLRRPKGIVFSWKNVLPTRNLDIVTIVNCRRVIWRRSCLNWSVTEAQMMILELVAKIQTDCLHPRLS